MEGVRAISRSGRYDVTKNEKNELRWLNIQSYLSVQFLPNFQRIRIAFETSNFVHFLNLLRHQKRDIFGNISQHFLKKRTAKNRGSWGNAFFKKRT